MGVWQFAHGFPATHGVFGRPILCSLSFQAVGMGLVVKISAALVPQGL
jgi:hypothetical protein